MPITPLHLETDTKQNRQYFQQNFQNSSKGKGAFG